MQVISLTVTCNPPQFLQWQLWHSHIPLFSTCTCSSRGSSILATGISPRIVLFTTFIKGNIKLLIRQSHHPNLCKSTPQYIAERKALTFCAENQKRSDPCTKLQWAMSQLPRNKRLEKSPWLCILRLHFSTCLVVTGTKFFQITIMLVFFSWEQ